jgi:hypothetical protein
MRPFHLLFVMTLFLLTAFAVQAREVYQPVKVRLVGAPTRVEPWSPFEGVLEIVAGRDVRLDALVAEATDAANLEIDLPADLVLAAGESREVPFRLTPTGPDPVISLTFTEQGHELKLPLPLAKVWNEWERGTAARLVPTGMTDKSELTWPDKRFPGVPAGVDPGPSDDGPDIEIRVDKDTAARTIHLEAQVAYRRQDGLQEFADGFPFIVYDSDVIYDDWLATGRTDEFGRIDVTFTWDPCIICETDPDLYIEVITRFGQVDIQTDHLERTYGWYTSSLLNFEGSYHDYGVMEVDKWSPAANMFQWYLRALEMLDLAGWYITNFDVQWPGWDTYYVDVFDEVHIAPEREWDESTYYHELGHRWQHQFAGQSSMEYCNSGGFCDDIITCTHCEWCEENTIVAQAEGMCNFIAFTLGEAMSNLYTPDPHVTEHTEDIPSCSGRGSICLCDPPKTEGFFTAFMQDLADFENEDDDAYPGYADECEFNPWDLMLLADNEHPHTIYDWWTHLQTYYPDQMPQIWATSMNNGFDLDLTLPSDVSGLVCTDHVVGVASPDATLNLTWDPATDPESGIAGYSWSITTGHASRPDDTVDLDFHQYRSEELTPGSYYFNVLAVDRRGYVSENYTSTGPLVIREPRDSDLYLQANPGWSIPVVATNVQFTESGGPDLPDSLQPYPAYTYWHFSGVNDGESSIREDMTNAVFLDGTFVDTMIMNGGSPNMTFGFKNRGPTQVWAGLHSMGVKLDQTEVNPETDETNNVGGYQLVWDPMFNMFPDTDHMQVDPPPNPIGGWDLVTPYAYNCFGYRFTASGFWNAVILIPFISDADYHLRIHEPSTGVNLGFGYDYGMSSRPPGMLQAVLANRNVTGPIDWDVGVVNNAHWDTSGFTVKQLTSTWLGDTGSESFLWTYEDVMSLFEFRVQNTNQGAVSIVVDCLNSDEPFTIARFDSDFSTGSLMDARDFAASAYHAPRVHRARLDLDIERTGFHGVAVWRERGALLGETMDMNIDVFQTPADLVPLADTDWCEPLVPRKMYANTPFVVSCPDTLYGNTAGTHDGTWLAACVDNHGPQDANSVPMSVYLDGEEVVTHEFFAVLSGIEEKVFFPDPIHVRGGRHTLVMQVDEPDDITEIYENNNMFVRQWVWSPAMLSTDTYIYRPDPPNPYGGYDELIEMEIIPSPNCDGLRLPAPLPSQMGNWQGVAVMPADTCNVNLKLFDCDPVMEKRYVDILEASSWGSSHLEYILVDNNLTPRRDFDLGVYHDRGEGDYCARALTSTVLGAQTSYEMSAVRLGNSDLAHLYEVDLVAGGWTFHLESVSATVDWGLALHQSDWDPYQNKLDHVQSARAYLEPEGVDETFTVTIDDPGNYCVVVWKEWAEDTTVRGVYNLHIDGAISGAVTGLPPLRSELVSIYPNPFNPQTTVVFDLARPGGAEIEIFNVKGERVRTITLGGLAATRHEVVWNGMDDRGTAVASGSYFMRLNAEGAEPTVRKAVLVR